MPSLASHCLQQKFSLDFKYMQSRHSCVAKAKPFKGAKYWLSSIDDYTFTEHSNSTRPNHRLFQLSSECSFAYYAISEMSTQCFESAWVILRALGNIPCQVSENPLKYSLDLNVFTVHLLNDVIRFLTITIQQARQELNYIGSTVNGYYAVNP